MISIVPKRETTHLNKDPQDHNCLGEFTTMQDPNLHLGK